MKKSVFGFFLATLISCLPLTNAWAWGPQGHALIADIAEHHLDEHARQEVKHLLAHEKSGHRLDEIASWADAIRGQRRETGPWHYVSIPRSADRYQARRDCPGDNCIVARLPRFVDILANRDASDARRLEALKFVVHFVGDIHQPMHAIDDDDAGGNAVKLRYFGQRSNLHKVWDSGIIKQQLGLYVGRGFTLDYPATRRAAARLDNDISTRERKRWQEAVSRQSLAVSAVDWANASHRLAREVAYGRLPTRQGKDWEEKYQRQVWPSVKGQLQRGGIRLAAVLNQALDTDNHD